jgi:cytidylate kinase
MSDDKITLFAPIIAYAFIGILCAAISLTIAYCLKRYALHFAFSAQLILSCTAFPLATDLYDYLDLNDGEDLIEWYMDRSLEDVARTAALVLAGLLPAWFVLRRAKEKIDVEAFR